MQHLSLIHIQMCIRDSYGSKEDAYDLFEEDWFYHQYQISSCHGIISFDFGKSNAVIIIIHVSASCNWNRTGSRLELDQSETRITFEDDTIFKALKKACLFSVSLCVVQQYQQSLLKNVCKKNITIRTPTHCVWFLV